MNLFYNYLIILLISQETLHKTIHTNEEYEKNVLAKKLLIHFCFELFEKMFSFHL